VLNKNKLKDFKENIIIFVLYFILGSTAKRSYIKKKTILPPRTPDSFGSNYSHHHSDTDLPPNMSRSLNRSISSLNEYKVSGHNNHILLLLLFI